jgi:hypothetical protein
MGAGPAGTSYLQAPRRTGHLSGQLEHGHARKLSYLRTVAADDNAVEDEFVDNK